MLTEGVASVTSGGSCLLSSIRCLLIGSYHKGGTQKRCGIVTYLARVFNATYVHVKLSQPVNVHIVEILDKFSQI